MRSKDPRIKPTKSLKSSKKGKENKPSTVDLLISRLLEVGYDLLKHKYE